MPSRKLRSGTALAVALLCCTPFVATVHAADHLHANKSDAELDLCGHVHIDNPELRAQAATRSYWRDERAANPNAWVRFKILGFNDFHGHLEPGTLFGRPVGGAAVLASYLKTKAEEAENGAIIVHAGDHVGASPPVSALLQDEPSITFLNLLANQQCWKDDKSRRHERRAEQHRKGHFSHQSEHHNANRRLNPACNLVGTLGNHEFDEGVDELQRLLNGGLHANGPFLDPAYDGAHFPYVVANVVSKDTGEPILPPYVIKRIKDMPVAFIGAVLKETPTIVTPSGVAGVEFLDEAESINRYVPELKAKGVRAIVVTIHQGTNQTLYSGPTDAAPMDVGGSIGPIVEALDDEIDVVVAGHWHRFTNALMPNKNGKLILVTQAFSYATAFSDIDVAIDPASRDIVEKSAQILTTWADEGPGLEPDERVAELVTAATAAVKPLVERVIGTASNDILRVENAAGESALGNLIADAQRAAMGSDIAFMNAGGIRADILAGDVTWGELFTVQPFNNDLVKLELTGNQIIRLLDQQWVGQPYARILKTSGIQYTWQENDPAVYSDNRVLAGSITVNGQPLDPNAGYSVVVNSFMAGGGDNYTVLTEGVKRQVGPVDLDALIDYIAALPGPFSYAVENRINVQP